MAEDGGERYDIYDMLHFPVFVFTTCCHRPESRSYFCKFRHTGQLDVHIYLQPYIASMFGSAEMDKDVIIAREAKDLKTVVIRLSDAPKATGEQVFRVSVS